MAKQKYDQDPRNVIIVTKIIKPMCPVCKTLNVFIRKVEETKLYCCKNCGYNSPVFIDA